MTLSGDPKTMILLRSVAIAVIAAMAAVSPAKAVIIDFTLTGELSGDVDLVPFADAAFSLTFSGDTDDLVPFTNGSEFDPISDVTFMIDGLPTATALEPLTFGFNDVFGFAFLFGAGGPDILDFEMAPGTDISMPIAPLAVTIAPGIFGSLQTDQGVLTISTFTNGIFSSTAAGIPTAGSLPLVFTGIGLLLIAARRRNA